MKGSRFIHWVLISLGLHLGLFSLLSHQEGEAPPATRVHAIAYLSAQPERTLRSRTGSGLPPTSQGESAPPEVASSEKAPRPEVPEGKPQRRTEQRQREELNPQEPPRESEVQGERAQQRAGFSADRRDWELTAEPLLASSPPPSYPQIALRRGWEGEVLLRVLVDRAGEVAAVEVETSSGYAPLDEAAVRAVTGWQFAPPAEGGEDFEVRVPIRFEIERP